MPKVKCESWCIFGVCTEMTSCHLVQELHGHFYIVHINHRKWDFILKGWSVSCESSTTIVSLVLISLHSWLPGWIIFTLNLFRKMPKTWSGTLLRREEDLTDPGSLLYLLYYYYHCNKNFGSSFTHFIIFDDWCFCGLNLINVLIVHPKHERILNYGSFIFSNQLMRNWNWTPTEMWFIFIRNYFVETLMC